MNKQSVCYIVCALPQERLLAPQPGDLVIAADAGYLNLKKFGIAPHLVAGDFDSLGCVPPGENVEVHPAMKDDTDMLLAVKAGLIKGYREFRLYGGLGGRLDHTLANLQTLCYILNRGGRGTLVGPPHAALLRDGTLRFEGGEGRLSVFAFGGNAKGVSLKGLLYPLTDALLTVDFPIGVSNEFLGGPASVSVESGTLLLVWEKGGIQWK